MFSYENYQLSLNNSAWCVCWTFVGLSDAYVPSAVGLDICKSSTCKINNLPTELELGCYVGKPLELYK